MQPDLLAPCRLENLSGHSPILVRAIHALLRAEFGWRLNMRVTRFTLDLTGSGGLS